MTWMFQGVNYDGRQLFELFPADRSNSTTQYTHNALAKWIAEGNRILVRIDEGARAGTIGEFVLPDNIHDLYNPAVGTSYYNRYPRLANGDKWELKFDDRKNIVKLEGTYRKNARGTLIFEQQDTVWAYETKSKPKVELPILHDHFGVELEVGQVCLALTGRGTSQYVRLGKITRWSAAGTIWVETMKTRATHPANAEVTVQGSINIFVLDGDIRSKAMMAKMMFT